MKNVLKIFIFILILFLILEIIGITFLGWDKVLKYGIYDTSSFEILQEDEDTIDTIFIGDSLIYSSISPMQIWHDYGFTSYDCASPGQPIILTYKYLEAAIKSQHPKVVFLGTGVLFRKLHTKPIDDMKDKIKNNIPIAYNHNDWKNLNSIDFYKGYKYITKVKPMEKEFPITPANKNLINKENLDYFNKIVSLCKQSNTKLILISFPSKKTWNYHKYNVTKQLSSDYNLNYIDTNFDVNLNIDWKSETKDGGDHLNYKGAEKVSKFIGEYMKKNNLVQDHRGDKKYQSWNEAYNKYIEDTNRQLLLEQ